MRKGQAAMEFLMTYGWAILVVLAAIGALAYFGVLSPDRFLPSKCVANPPFSCTEFKLNTTHVALTLQNNAGVDLADVFYYMSTSTGSDCTGGSASVYNNVANGNAIGGGIKVWGAGGCSGLKTGDRFNGNYTLIYRKAGESVNHTSTGSIQARVE